MKNYKKILKCFLILSLFLLFCPVQSQPNVESSLKPSTSLTSPESSRMARRTGEILREVYDCLEFCSAKLCFALEDLAKMEEHQLDVLHNGDTYGQMVVLLNVETLDPASTFECNKTILENLADEEYEILIHILITGTIESMYFESYFFSLLCENFLINIKKDISILTADYFIRKWSPLEQNISGFAMYREDTFGNSTNLVIKEIYRGQTSTDVDVRSLEIAACFLDQQLRSLSMENKKKFHPLMVFTTKNSKFKISAWTVNTPSVVVGIPTFYTRKNSVLVEAYLLGGWGHYGHQLYYIAKMPDYRRSVRCYIDIKISTKQVDPSLESSRPFASPVGSGMVRRTSEILRNVYDCINFCQWRDCFAFKDLTYDEVIRLHNQYYLSTYGRMILSLNVETLDPAYTFECNKILPQILTHDEYEIHIHMFITSAILSNLEYNSHFYSVFNKFLLNIKKDFFISNTDYYLRMWSPLEQNISGFAMYREDNSENSTNLFIKEIYAGQTSRDVKLTNLEIAAYIPYQQIKSLLEKNKEKLYAVMLYVTKNSKFKGILGKEINTPFVGIAVPGFYKKNSLELLEAYLEERWAQYGENFYDIFSSPEYTRVISKMLYFGWKEADSFEKVELLMEPSTTVASPVDASMVQRTGKILRTVYDCLTFFSEIICSYATDWTENVCDVFIDVKSSEKVMQIADEYAKMVELLNVEALDPAFTFKCNETLPQKFSFEEHEIYVNILLTKFALFKFDTEIHHLRPRIEALLLHIKNPSFISNADYFIRKWSPVEQNVSGFALYCEGNSENIKSCIIKDIYAGQTSTDINVTNLEIAAYIPQQQLKDLFNQSSSDLSEQNKKQLIVMMIFSTTNSIFQKILGISKNTSLVGVSIPGFLKRNNLILLEVYLDGRWNQFGEDYYDAYNILFEGVLDRISYFGWSNRGILETVWDKYCQLNYSKGNITLSFLMLREGLYSAPLFCMGNYLNVPTFACYERRSVEFHCSTNFLESNWTECLYQLYIYRSNSFYSQGISNKNKCKAAIADMTLVDIFMYYWLTMHENINNPDKNVIAQLLTRSLELIENQILQTSQMTYIATFCSYKFSSDEYLSEKFIYLNISNLTETPGFVLRREGVNSFSRSSITYLTNEYLKDLHEINDNSVEVIAYNLNKTLSGSEVYFYILNVTQISEDGNHVCSSRVLIMSNREENSVTFSIYLKITNYRQLWYNQGFWFNVTLADYTNKILCISEPHDNICNDGSKVFILNYYWDESEISSVKNAFQVEVNILSQLSLTMSPTSKDTYDQHFEILKVIMLVGTSLSILGIAIILCCSVLLKDWCKKRICTFQLSLVYLFELAFFLIENDKITHVVYLIFYYSLLTQFSWMCIIGYIQYKRFIKVFDSVEVGIVKFTIAGWLPPAVFILIPTYVYSDCLKCNLCYNNSSIFAYFVIIPISLIITGNTILYFVIMFKFSHPKFPLTPKAKRARLRAAIMFPFLFGIFWLSTFAMFSDWPTISVIGSYFFHIIVPSQGFVLSIFVVGFDKDTRKELRAVFVKLLTCRQSVALRTA